MALKNYSATVLTGGGSGALDSIDGTNLQDKDSCIVFDAATFYFYTLDDDSGAAESSPDVISPDANAGNKRWLLMASLGIGGVITLANTGLHLLDSDATHDLIIKPGSNLTADKTLTITTGDSDRTITLSGNPTLADWFDQAVKAASSPTFANATITTAITLANTGLHLLDSNASHDLIIKPGSDLTADRTLTLTTGNADRTVTLGGNLTVAGTTTISAFGATITDDASAAAVIATLGIDADITTLSLPASTTISAFGSTLVDDANAAAVIATLGIDADLATLSLPASTTISAFGATLTDDANAATALGTLGLTATAAEINSGVDGLTATAAEINTICDGTNLLTFTVPASTTISAFAKTVVDDASASAVRTTIGCPSDPAAGTAGLRTLGTTAVKACAGNDARLSDARSPTNNSVSVAQLVAPTAGTVIIGRHDVVATTLSETYVLMKMFTVLQTGTFRTSFAIRGINAATTAYGRIYKNGAAFGTERSKRDNTYQTFTEDLAFNVGDTCEMWLKNSNAGAYVQSFRMSVATVCIGVARGD